MEEKLIAQNKQIKQIYLESVYESLEDVKKELLGKLEELFKKKEKNYSLILENSIYENIELYTFKGRVKNEVSLYEKLFRKKINILTELSEKEKISKILEIDDLIGIRILTSLRCDCKKVFNLLKEESKEIEGLELDFTDEIPTPMKNGKLIYKIKGKYLDKKFELQIKSNLDSSWGDIEHTLFYKDYLVNEVKKNNSKIMGNIGDILEKLEETMENIRESRSLYSEDEREKFKLIDLLEEKFKDKLSNKYGIDFSLEGIAKFILSLPHEEYSLEKLDENTELYCFNHEVTSRKEKNLRAVIFNELESRCAFHLYNLISKCKNEMKMESFFEKWYAYLLKINGYDNDIYLNVELKEDIKSIMSENKIPDDFFDEKIFYKFIIRLKTLIEICEDKNIKEYLYEKFELLQENEEIQKKCVQKEIEELDQELLIDCIRSCYVKRKIVSEAGEENENFDVIVDYLDQEINRTLSKEKVS